MFELELEDEKQGGWIVDVPYILFRERMQLRRRYITGNEPDILNKVRGHPTLQYYYALPIPARMNGKNYYFINDNRFILDMKTLNQEGQKLYKELRLKLEKEYRVHSLGQVVKINDYVGVVTVEKPLDQYLEPSREHFITRIQPQKFQINKTAYGTGYVFVPK